jgi:hypothetical protein
MWEHLNLIFEFKWNTTTQISAEGISQNVAVGVTIDPPSAKVQANMEAN